MQSVDLIDPTNDFEVSINYDLSCPSAGGGTGAAHSQPHQIIQFARAERVVFKPNYIAIPLHFTIYVEDGNQAEADRIATEVNGLEGVYEIGGNPVAALCFASFGYCVVEVSMDSLMYTKAEARDLLESISGNTVEVNGRGGRECDADTGFMTDKIPYTTLSHNQNSGFGGKLTATFDNEEDFAEFWAKHASYG